MASPQLLSRMKREIKMLEEEPPHGIYCWPSETNIRHLYAQIRGYEKTPYENGIFKLDINIPDRYPFEPPHIQFKTPIYHPNVDNDGRICLDILKLPPKGSWKPSLNISTVLTSISVLMQDPNPDDPLLTEIANEYKSNYPLFVMKAKDYTKKYAITNINDATNEVCLIK
ncbi:ubiquitin-conjugating enzyme/RWD-like protein [Neocallimastix lanati (nom. inval.)]|nr:ubiquitin-conjugating enzyme/RWD-like protein [Neocallimastix sp. JGI-2020a]